MQEEIILIICTGYFGDILLSSKLTRDIKKYYPQSKLVYICDSPYLSVTQNIPGVDEVYPYDRKKNANLFNYIKFIFKFPYKNKIKHTFILHQNKKSRIMLAKNLGAKEITTWESFKNKSLYAKTLKDYPTHSNVAYFNADLLNDLTDKITDDKDIEIRIPESIQLKTDSMLKVPVEKPLIAINPQARDKTKCWNEQEFTKLVKHVISRGKTPVITGLSKDGTTFIDALNEDSEINKNDYINLIDKTSFLELGAVYKRCSMVVSIDTGSAHIASAVGAVTLVLFFREDAYLWAPINTAQNDFIYGKYIHANDVAIKMDTMRALVLK